MNPVTSGSRIFSPYESVVAPYRAAEESTRATRDSQFNTGLGKIWLPGFRRPLCASWYFNRASSGVPDYGKTLFSERQDVAEALFGLMGYHVDREVVTSLGNRLSELGEQTVYDSHGAHLAVPMNLQERPDGALGNQALILTKDGSFDAQAVEAALIRAIDVPNAVKIEKFAPDAKRHQNIHAEFIIPKDISWDGLEHHVDLEFTVKLPKEGHKDLQTWLMSAIHLVNGRPAQHYQDEAAAVISLEEILFADKKSVKVVIDKGLPNAFNAEPDTFLGKSIALLLTQTAGGFFEHIYLQTVENGEVKLSQKSPDGSLATPHTSSAFTDDGDGGRLRVTDFGYAAVATSSRYTEKEVSLPDGRKVYELSHLAVMDRKDHELVAVDFNVGDGRGLRDLGVYSSLEQIGRFKMSVNGQSGFAYGEFIVSPTIEIESDESGEPVYYSTVTLRPKFSRDMARKKIVLHVVQTKDGVYSETQVVPESLVIAPPQGITPTFPHPQYY